MATPHKTLAKVLYSFNAESDVELTLQEGSYIAVVRQDVGDGWWEGETPAGARGLFPKDYVSLMPPGGTLGQTASGLDDSDDEGDAGESREVELAAEKLYVITEGPKWECATEPIRVLVGKPERKSKYSGMKQFITYEVESKMVKDKVQRRYKHFSWLYDRLRETFPCVSVPRLPEKHVQANFVFEDNFIEKRRRGLEMFLNRVARHPVLGSSNVFHHFLSASDYADWKMGKRSAEREAGERTFLDSVEIPQGHPPDTKDIDEFVKYAKRSERTLTELSNAVDAIAARRADLKNEYIKVLMGFRKLIDPQLQPVRSGRSMSQPQIDLLAPPPTPCSDTFCWRPQCHQCLPVTRMIAKLSTELTAVSAIINAQSAHDVAPLAEMLRDQMGSLKAFPSVVKAHDASIEAYNQAMQKDKESPQSLLLMRRRCDTMTNVLLAELDHFHGSRLLDYHEILRSFAMEQAVFHRKIAAAWNEVLDSFNTMC